MEGVAVADGDVGEEACCLLYREGDLLLGHPSRQSLLKALISNLTTIPLAAGLLHPLLGFLFRAEASAAAMVASDIIVVGNSLLLRRKPL